MNTQTSDKVPLMTLTAMVVGGMVGAGVFSIPRNFAMATGVYGALIAWTIAGVGMLMLAFVFQTLANRKPDLDAGVYAYARAGFGPYLGFASAFGYWASACVGNVSYWVLIKSTLGGVASRSSATATRWSRSRCRRSASGCSTSWCCAAPRKRRPSTRSSPSPRSSRCMVFLVLADLRLQDRCLRASTCGGGGLTATACSSRSRRRCWSRCSCSSASKAPASIRALPRSAATSARPRSLGFIIVLADVRW